jgi:glucuronate isomerase
MGTNKFELSPDRFFSPEPSQRKLARELYESIDNLPIISPHGHVDPRLFSDNKASFGSPADLLIIPDHYVFRMLYSQGITPDRLGVPRLDGQPVESNHRAIWQIFADHFYLFRGTPSGVWLNHELATVFDVTIPLNQTNAQVIYDQIAEKLATPEYRPRALFEKFNIEVLSTTDAAADKLDAHQAIRDSGWKGKIIPTFRPDNVINLTIANWKKNIDDLGAVSEIQIKDYASFIQALENRRAYFKKMGAHATDHAALTAFTVELSRSELNDIFQRALKGQASQRDSERFTGHMLMEMARMSIEDGLVMQLHVGSFRNHNETIFEQYGWDKGADIPVAVELTHNLHSILNKYGNDPRLRFILFLLDESVYARELATLAGHYPALKIGPPWWFHDSLNGMARYFDQVMETAGLYNTVGFNDDTRAFPSIPARHDTWRRASANWLAGMVVRDLISRGEAEDMCIDMAYRLPKRAYRLD